MIEERRPSVFIGSSAEGLPIAKAIQANLDHAVESVIWSQGLFGLGGGTLESLFENLNQFDFAVLVLTPDDLTTSRAETSKSPRDNVLFELGLFMGAIGRLRTFIVHERLAPLKLPSDLAGVTAATFERHRSGNWQSTLGQTSTHIEAAVQKLGRRIETCSTGSEAIVVDVYYHRRGFTQDLADRFATRLMHAGMQPRVLEHSGPYAPDAAFIGSMITAEEARFVLGNPPHRVKYLYRADYPESEGGDLRGRRIGLGYASRYNVELRDERAVPFPITPSRYKKLMAPTLSNAEFHWALHAATSPS